MVGLAIRFDLGRYHANPWGSHVNDAAVEWPPSPWRLLRGLYSVGRTHLALAERQGDLDRALAALATAPPPTFQLPPATAAHTRHYMSVPSGPSEKSAKILDGFLAVDPEAELVAWWEANLDAAARGALSGAARALGYLGRSESVCTAALKSDAERAEPLAKPLADFDGATAELDKVDLLCVDAGDPIRALATSVAEIRRERRFRPPGTREVAYGVPRVDAVARGRGRRDALAPDLALFRLRGASRPALTEAVAAAQLLRSALQSRFGGLHDGGTSVTFSGRAGEDSRRDQHQHAHFLALPDAHGRRVDRLVVWAPEGFGDGEVAALGAVRRLWAPRRGKEIADLPLALGALGRAEEMRLPAVLGPARKWQSLTPFGLVRHPKVKRGKTVDSPEEQVARELAYRGLPKPRAIAVERGSQWHRFRSSKVGTSRTGRAPLTGVTLRFDEKVSGPIALGALSHYGLGLMRPVDPA